MPEADSSRTLKPKEQQQSFYRKLFGAIVKGVILYFLFKVIQNWILIVKPPAFINTTTTTLDASSSDDKVLKSAWEFGQKADLFVYLSEQAIQTTFNESNVELWKKESIEFGSFGKEMYIEKTFNYTLPKRKKDSNPIFAHIYLVKQGFHPNPDQSKFDPVSTVYRRMNLIGTMPRPATTLNLISGHEKLPDNHQQSLNSSLSETVSYWYPEIRISLVQDNTPLKVSMLPFHTRRHLSLSLDGKSYLPTLYMNEFWQLKAKRIIINDEMEKVPLKITFNPIGITKFQILTNFDQSLQMNESLFGGDGETEKLKQMFIETNPYLLMATLAVSLLHSTFDFLAFKNDIQFWKQRNNLEGLSVRSVLVNAAFQLVIFLYLLDQETSWLILVSVAIGTLIEMWKITRVLSIRIYFKSGSIIPKLEVKDRVTYAESLTQKYDEMAMKYLGMASIPLLIGYSIYSLIYQNHKGWYSWLLGTLVGFVYAFGFIMMTPQLFINYKLKSVAHMPWRVFIYKALNTFIDDLFAFIIKMPILHRLACLRDDFIFIIYLYQRWVYPVDKSRVNEYGQVFDHSQTITTIPESLYDGEVESEGEAKVEGKGRGEGKVEGEDKSEGEGEAKANDSDKLVTATGGDKDGFRKSLRHRRAQKP